MKILHCELVQLSLRILLFSERGGNNISLKSILIADLKVTKPSKGQIA